MADRPSDRRPTLTLKGEEFTPEFRSLLNKAAKKVGKTQAAFAAEVLAAASRRVLSGTPDDTPSSTPPVNPETLITLQKQFESQLADNAKQAREQIEATNAKLDRATQTIEMLATQMQALTENQRKNLWQRLFSKGI